MSDEKKKVADGQVVSMDYTLRVDGEIVDTSEGREPLEFLQGAGNIIPGLEKELYDMEIGDKKQVSVEPENAYGPVYADAFIDVPRNSFPESIPLEVGTELQVMGPENQPLYARIAEVGEETIKLDLNHPLAGKTLLFDVEIMALRDATDEEKDHGHVHGAGHHH